MQRLTIYLIRTEKVHDKKTRKKKIYNVLSFILTTRDMVKEANGHLWTHRGNIKKYQFSNVN